MKRVLSYLIMLGGSIMVSSQSWARTVDNDSLMNRDFVFVKSRDPWLTASNAAAFTRYQSPSISMAEISIVHRKGGFVNYDESPDAWSTGVLVESFYRLSPNIVAYGKMGYDNFSGKNMTGSAFIDTSRQPFDIAEDSLTNEGKKRRDTYSLVGAIGWEVWKGLSIGAKIDFTAANAAKYKDLRHKTKLMNLEATSGVYASLDKKFSMGACYTYRRNTESLIFSTYGKSDKVYNSFINYGPWVGEVEQFSDNGFTDRSREMPLLSEYHKGGMQLSWNISENLMWYATLNYGFRNGYYGRKSPYTIVYMQHNSHLLDYHTKLQWKNNSQEHHLDISYDEENLVNHRNTYRSLVNEAGASYYEYYDPVKTANRLWRNWHTGYTAYLGIKGNLPIWTFCIGVNQTWRKQTGYDYPFYRRQELVRTEVLFYVGRNIKLRKSILSIDLGLSYIRGKGEPYVDGTFIEPSDKQKGMVQMKDFLYREYHYITSLQYNVSGGVKYAFHIPDTGMNAYVALGASCLKTNAQSSNLVGRDNTGARMVLGCVF